VQCDTSENISVVLVFLACASGGVVLAVMAAAFSIFALAIERNRMKVLLDAHTWLSILLATAFACNKLLLTSMKTLFCSIP